MKSKEALNAIKEETESKKPQTLTNDELAQVSGSGEVRSDTYGGVTRMKCDFCGYSPEWAGDYMGQTLDCPGCGRHQFHGDYWVRYK